MANDIKVLKNNTLEELRQKTNEVSFNQYYKFECTEKV